MHSPASKRGAPSLTELVANEVWSGRRGSNPRHSAWKADALPTELLPPETEPMIDDSAVTIDRGLGNLGEALLDERRHLSGRPDAGGDLPGEHGDHPVADPANEGRAGVCPFDAG
jgi:hypothetical protein